MTAIAQRRVQRLLRAVAATATAAVALAILPAAASASPAAACQEYVVCGQPAGGPSGSSGSPANPALPHADRGPRPSVHSQTDLPLTSYPVTPILAVLASVLAVGLVVGFATSARARSRRAARA